MSQSKNDRTYNAGRKAAQRGGFISDLAVSLTRGMGGKKSGIYDKGYSAGQRDRGKRR